MTAQMRNVFSSTIQQIGHDPADNSLYVLWNNGKTSVYEGVPSDLAQQVMNAPSVGSALHASVKMNFPHRYYTPEAPDGE